MKDTAERKKLVEIINGIRVAHERGESDADLLRQADSIVPDADVSILCDSDWDSGVIADYCLGLRKAQRILTRDELLELVQSIRRGPSVSEAEDTLRVRLFMVNCIHPAKSDLFFYPENVDPGRDRFSDEEIVTLALGGKVT